MFYQIFFSDWETFHCQDVKVSGSWNYSLWIYFPTFDFDEKLLAFYLLFTVLQVIFNFSFRNQWKIIRSVLYDKRDNCVVMATGLNFYNVVQGNFHCLKLNIKNLIFLLQSSCKSAVSKWEKFWNDLNDLEFLEKKRRFK